MLLHHTTNRSACQDIARDGLTDNGDGYVHLTPDVWSWRQNGMVDVGHISKIGRDEVVFSYDVPDDIAVGCLLTPTIGLPVDPDDGPDMEDYDPEVDGRWHEYHIPADVVNRYFAGIAFWHGDCPISSEALKGLWERRC